MEKDPCCTIGDYLLLDRVRYSEGSIISRAVHMSTQKMVTVKLLDKNCFTHKITDLKELDHNNGCFSTNISNLKKLDHDNVVKVLDGLLLNQSIPVSADYYPFYGDPSPFQLRTLLVMEYRYGSDLWQWLREVEDLGHSSKLDIFSQMVDGVNYLHKQNVFHGRIRPSNVWVQGGRPMLCGFGLSNNYDGAWEEWEQLEYAPPECFELNHFPHPPGKKSDVFSLGIILVQLHSRGQAFHDWNGLKMYRLGLCKEQDLQSGAPFIQLPDQHCLTNFMKRLLYLMINPVYDLRIGVELVKDMLNNEMDLM